MYLSHGGVNRSRRTLIKKLSQNFGPDLLVLSGVGVASLVLLRGRASKLIIIVATNEDDDDLGMALDKVANQIIHESKELSKCRAKNSYQSRVNIDTALDAVSATALSLLGKLSSKLNHTMPAVLIGNIITSVLINQATMLRIALANVLNRKCLIEQMYAFRVTCSYSEARRFKAPAEAVKDSKVKGIAKESPGLVQVVSDNFDATILSQNGLRSTHSLAVLLTMPDTHDTTADYGTTDEIKQAVTVVDDVPVQRLNGPKKPHMPSEEATRAVLVSK